VEALPINKDILGTHNSVVVRPYPSLSPCCNVEGTRKSYHAPFPITQCRSCRANVYKPLTSASCGGAEEGLSSLSPSIPHPGHTRHGIAQYRDLYPSCGSTQTSNNLFGPSNPESSRGYPFAKRSPNDAQKRKHTSNRCSLLCPGGEET